MTSPILERLQAEVIRPLKDRFVDREEVIDLIALAVVAGEHLFLYGPPGTAKSALIHQFAAGVRGRYFDYMLTRFSEPNEIFGPIDIAKLREGTVVTVTTGMLPEAEFVFLDELFNANSAILNNLLTVLNERTYRRGAETHRLPLLSLFSASNRLPDDDALRALFDRFLIRCHLDNLKRGSMGRLLQAGWTLETSRPLESTLTSEDLRNLARTVYQVDLSGVQEEYIEAIFKVRDLGVALSDRRAVKVMKLLAASAVLCGREQAAPSDLWVLRFVWDREEQIEPLAALVNGILQRFQKDPARHPLSSTQAAPVAEELARQLESMEAEVAQGSFSLRAASLLRERLTDLADRAAWLSEPRERDHIAQRIRACLQRLG